MAGPGPGLDSRAISSIDLSPYFADKTTAEALVGGTVWFYSDFNRTQPKLVYELTYDSGTGQYSYAALPNPITIGAAGNFQDAGGDNVAVYYYPFDEFGNQELYYISVYDSNGLLQFTRDAWPFPWSTTSGETASSGGVTNMLTNPQFTKVNFLAGATYSITYSAGTTSINIAPGWVLNITATGSGTASVEQTPIAGSTRAPNNPPFALTFVAGANISAWDISQRLSNNPDWAAPQVTGNGGYVATTIMITAASVGEIVIEYLTSNGAAAQTLFQDTNTTGANAQFYNTVELVQGVNSDTGLTGYDTIKINIPIAGTTGISNVQVVPLQDDISGVLFEQTPANRQLDLMFNYYKSLLDYKPIASYLTGWDFPLNPAQFLGATVAASSTAPGKSKYVWDQTILFQGTDNTIGVTRATSGAIKLTAASAATGGAAIIQYLNATKIKDILNHAVSVNVEYKAAVGASRNATVSLWYTADANLPVLTAGTSNSLVATLDANGKPATFNGTWVEVPRVAASPNTNNALFSMANNTSDTYDSAGFGFWNPSIVSAVNSATFFAIVIGTAPLLVNETVEFLTVSLVPGNVPTIPAPQSADEVIRECQYYYEQSYNGGVVAGTSTASGQRLAGMNGYVNSGTGFLELHLRSFGFEFLQIKRASPVMTFYTPAGVSGSIQTNWFLDGSATTAAVNTGIANWNQTISPNSISLVAANTTGSITTTADAITKEALALYHYVADARLGLV